MLHYILNIVILIGFYYRVHSRADCRARLRQPTRGPEERVTAVALVMCGHFQPAAAFNLIPVSKIDNRPMYDAI